MRQYLEERATVRVVVGVDGSQNAELAARWAAGEAQARGASLTLTHALNLPTGAALPLEPPHYAAKRRAEGRELLTAASKAISAEFPDLAIDTEVSDLSPAHTLSALSLESALVVTGTRGHGGFTGMLVGSVSHKLAAHAHSPLVVVRGGPPQAAINEVVLGVEPNQAPAAIRYAFAAAQRYGANLHAVRAWFPRFVGSSPTGRPDSDLQGIRAAQEHTVEELLAPFRSSFPEVKVEITAAPGNPVALLDEAARSTRLLVVGSHRRRGPLSIGAGYVVDGLIAHCPTPVAVVPID